MSDAATRDEWEIIADGLSNVVTQMRRVQNDERSHIEYKDVQAATNGIMDAALQLARLGRQVARVEAADAHNVTPPPVR